MQKVFVIFLLPFFFSKPGFSLELLIRPRIERKIEVLNLKSVEHDSKKENFGYKKRALDDEISKVKLLIGLYSKTEKNLAAKIGKIENEIQLLELQLMKSKKRNTLIKSRQEDLAWKIYIMSNLPLSYFNSQSYRAEYNSKRVALVTKAGLMGTSYGNPSDINKENALLERLEDGYDLLGALRRDRLVLEESVNKMLAK